MIYPPAVLHIPWKVTGPHRRGSSPNHHFSGAMLKPGVFISYILHILCRDADRKSSWTDVGQKENGRTVDSTQTHLLPISATECYLGGFMFFIFTTIWGRFPIWLIVFRWVETTNQLFRTFRLFQANRLVKYMITFTQRLAENFQFCWSTDHADQVK